MRESPRAGKGVRVPSSTGRPGPRPRLREAHCLAILFLFWAVVYASFYPGIVNLDTIDMLDQALTGSYHDWHSPLLSAAWRALNSVLPGPPLMLLLFQAGLITGLWLLLREAFERAAFALISILVILLCPPILNVLGLVTKDSAFLSIYAFYLFSVWRALRPGAKPGPAFAALTLLAFIGLAVRRDGAPFFACGFVALYGILLRPRDRSPEGGTGDRGRIARAARMLAAPALAMVTIMALAGLTGVVNRSVLHARPRYSFQTTMIHDIAAVSVAADRNLLPEYIRREKIDLVFLKSRYSPRAHDPLNFRPEGENIRFTSDPEEFRALRTAWLTAIRGHPRAYLEHRARTFLHLVDLVEPFTYQLYQLETDTAYRRYWPNFRELNLEPRSGGALQGYRERIAPLLAKTPLYRGYFYDIVILAAVALAGRGLRGRGAGRSSSEQRRPIFVVIVGAGAAAHQSVLFFTSPAAHFRYLFPSVLSCLVMAAVAWPCLKREGRALWKEVRSLHANVIAGG